MYSSFASRRWRAPRPSRGTSARGSRSSRRSSRRASPGARRRREAHAAVVEYLPPCGSIRTAMQPRRSPSSRSGATAISPRASSPPRTGNFAASSWNGSSRSRTSRARSSGKETCRGGRRHAVVAEERPRDEVFAGAKSSWPETGACPAAGPRRSTARSSTSSSDSAETGRRLKSSSAFEISSDAFAARLGRSASRGGRSRARRRHGRRHLEEPHVVLVELVDAERR